MNRFSFTSSKLTWFLAFFLAFSNIQAQKKSKNDSPKWAEQSISAFTFRGLGPATTSGRIADIAVNPDNTAEMYIALASSGVWKTSNNGTTWEPIFDHEGSYSTGCVTMDPSNHNIIWIGSGENNNQRSVAYGDGVYVSRDAGKTWTNTGLVSSEHIGMITVVPINSNHVYVAA